MQCICVVSVRRCTPLWARWRRRGLPACHLLVSADVFARLGFSGGGVGWVPSPPCPRPSSPGTPFPSGVTPEVHSPPQQLFHTGGLDAPRQLDPPYHSMGTPPPEFFTTPEALQPPLCPLLQRTLWPGFSEGSQPFPFSLVSPHGGLPLPPHLLPWR